MMTVVLLVSGSLVASITIIRYSDLSHLTKSVATISQGLLGMREGFIGSFVFCC